MTNEEAMVFMDNLIICIKEHPILADWLVEIANRKVEPNNYESKCCKCRWWSLEFGCQSKYKCEFKPKTKCDTCKTYWNCQGQCDEMPQIEDEPQIEETQDGFYDDFYRDHEEFYEF